MPALPRLQVSDLAREREGYMQRQEALLSQVVGLDGKLAAALRQPENGLATKY